MKLQRAMLIPTAFRAFICVLFCSALISISFAQQQSASPEQITKAVLQLDSNSFIERQIAMQFLMKQGMPAIEPLGNAVEVGNPEVRSRAIRVFQELAIHEDMKVAEAAEQRLRDYGEDENLSLASRAKKAILMIATRREEAALNLLKEKGAKFLLNSINGQSITFDDQWKGTNDELRQIRWLKGVEELKLMGKKFNGESLKVATTVPNANRIAIVNCNVENKSMEHLLAMKTLTYITITNCKQIDNDVIPTLKKIELASEFKLYGTAMTREAAMTLSDEENSVEIDFRRGGFLGIRCYESAEKCEVTSVEPNATAANVGMQVGDIIVKFNKEQIKTMSDLTKKISFLVPGTEVEIEWIRDGKNMKAKGKLSEWNQ